MVFELLAFLSIRFSDFFRTLLMLSELFVVRIEINWLFRHTSYAPFKRRSNRQAQRKQGLARSQIEETAPSLAYEGDDGLESQVNMKGAVKKMKNVTKLCLSHIPFLTLLEEWHKTQKNRRHEVCG